MRRLTAREAKLLQLGHYAVHARAWIQDAGGTWRNLSSLFGEDWLAGVTVAGNIDQPVASCTLEVIREIGEISLSPFMDASRANLITGAAAPLLRLAAEIFVEAAITEEGAEPGAGDWRKIFAGFVDNVDATSDPITMECRDSAGQLLQDAFVEEELIYALTRSAELARPWVAGATYYTGERICPSTGPDGYVYTVGAGLGLGGRQAGTTEPDWSTLRDAGLWTTATTGGVTIQFHGANATRYGATELARTTAYQVGDLVAYPAVGKPSPSYYNAGTPYLHTFRLCPWRCVQAGTTAAYKPDASAWSVAGETDGTAKWVQNWSSAGLLAADNVTYGQPLGDVIYTLLRDWAGPTIAAKFSQAADPGWMIRPYQQSRAPLLTAITDLAMQIGWDFRQLFDPSIYTARSGDPLYTRQGGGASVKLTEGSTHAYSLQVRSQFATRRHLWNRQAGQIFVNKRGRGAVLEDGRPTNLCKQSQSLATSPWWVAGAISVAGGVSGAPDGTSTVCRLSVTADGSSISVGQTLTLPTVGPLTFSFWIRATGTAGAADFALYSAGYLPAAAKILSGPGSVSFGSYGRITGLSTSAWTRVALTMNAAMNLSVSAIIYPGSVGLQTAGQAVDVWGAQVEQWPEATYYVPTTVAAATGTLPNYAGGTPDGAAAADTIACGVMGADDIWSSAGSFTGDEYVTVALWIKRISTSGTMEIHNAYGGARGQWIVDLAKLPDRWVKLHSASPYVVEIHEWQASPAGWVGFHFNAPAYCLFQVWGTDQAGAAGLTFTDQQVDGSQITTSWVALLFRDDAQIGVIVPDTTGLLDVGAVEDRPRTYWRSDFVGRTPAAGETIQLGTLTTPALAAPAPDAIRLEVRAQAATRNLLENCNFAAAAWRAGKFNNWVNPTVAQNAAIAPDGTLTADCLTAQHATANALGQSIGASMGRSYQGSVWIKLLDATAAPVLTICEGNNLSTYAGLIRENGTSVVNCAASVDEWRLFKTNPITIADAAVSKVELEIGWVSTSTPIGTRFYVWGAQLVECPSAAAVFTDQVVSSTPIATSWVVDVYRGGRLVGTVVPDSSGRVDLGQVDGAPRSAWHRFTGTPAEGTIVHFAGLHHATGNTGGSYRLKVRALAGAQLIRANRSLERVEWVKDGAVTVTANASLAPDGSRTADHVSGLAVDAAGRLYVTTVGNYVAGAHPGVFLWIKRISTSGVLRVYSTSNDGAWGEWRVDLATLPAGWVRIHRASPYVSEISRWTMGATGQGGIAFCAVSGAGLSVAIWGVQFTNDDTLTPTEQENAGVAALTTSWVADVEKDGTALGTVVPDQYGRVDLGALEGAPLTGIYARFIGTPVAGDAITFVGPVGYVGDFRFTLYNPDRSKTIPDLEIGPDGYVGVTQLAVEIEGVRTAGQVVYSDAESVQPNGSDYPRKVEKGENAAAVAKYRRRWFEIAEGSTSNVNRQAEALAELTAALADLSEPKASHAVAMRYCPGAELGDLYRFKPNGVHYSSPMDLAVVSHSARFTGSAGTVEIECRGKPAGAFNRWHSRLAAPGIAQPARTLAPPNVNSVEVLKQGTTTVIRVPPQGGALAAYDSLELYLCAAITDAPSGANYYGEIKGDLILVSKAAGTYYGKLIAKDRAGNPSPPSSPFTVTI